MHRCPQTKGQSVLEHGFSVNEYLHDLLSTSPSFNWKLPEYFDFYREFLVDALYPLRILDSYTTYHDCGKPYCAVTNTSGNHFPDHANISQQIYKSLSGDSAVTNLIGWDMVLHTCTAKELDTFLETWSEKDASTLFLVALCELHSNAALFGGSESTSFKIKYKRLSKRGKQLCKHFFIKEVK